MKYTGKDKTILIICRDIRDIHLASRIKHDTKNRYIVASDDIRAHKALKNLPWVDEVCFIEQMESYYNVVSNVIRILGEVNQWLKSIGDDDHGIPQELLFWICHCEGGMTTQRIQDLLLLIRSYLVLLERNEINNVIILCNPEYKWEDDVLLQTARSRNIPVQEINRFSFKRLMLPIVDLVKLMAYEPYYILKIIKSKVLLLASEMRADNQSREVIFQMFSSADKHVEMVAPFMKSMKNCGYHPIAQCWNARAGAVKIRQKGLRADELENWVSVSDICISSCHVFRTWRRALTRKKSFISHVKLTYENVDLGKLLWCSVVHFVWAELGQLYRLRSALIKYFKQHQPLAIKLWGGTTFAEGIITLRSLNRDKTSLFNYVLAAVGYKEPYAEAQKENQTELFLASSVSVKEMIEQTGLASDRIVVVGQGRYDDIPKLKLEYTADESRAYLRIPEHFKLYLLFDPNCILRGYVTSQEQVRNICCLLDFVKENPSVALIIKPHPSHKVGILERIIKEYSLVNVFLIDKNVLPYHALNAADILIYKFTTLGYEAMLFDKPGISVILDGEDNFKIYKDGAEYIYSTDKLQDLLKRIAKDDAFRLEWIKLRLKKQKEFLQYHFPDDSKPKADLAADALDKFIKEKQKIKGELSCAK